MRLEGYAHVAIEIWPETRVKDLIRRWNIDGDSSGVIAAAYGVTRQAVCAKVMRLRQAGVPMAERVGPAGRRGGAKKKSAAPVYDKPAPLHTRIVSKAPPRQTPKPPVAKSRPPVPVPVVIVGKTAFGAAAAIDSLTATQCRWPINDTLSKDFHFCNRQKIPGLPYCECHARIAYQPPKAKIRHEAAQQAPVATEATTRKPKNSQRRRDCDACETTRAAMGPLGTMHDPIRGGYLGPRHDDGHVVRVWQVDGPH